jgi:hypothetical protein
MRHLASLLLLQGLLLTTSCAVTSVTPETQLSQEAAVPSVRSRLKFKGAGPVCMCNSGLSERDIARGTRPRKPPAGSAP